MVEHLSRVNAPLPQTWDVVPVIDIEPGIYRNGPTDTTLEEQITYVKTQLNSIVPYFPPGSVWVVGNEMDRPALESGGQTIKLQDDELPEDYAVIYHDIYEHVKALDPTSSVVIGGVVQPTPIRLRYLDMVLDAYEERYGERLPTDAWHVHNMVLNEIRVGSGAGIPPGITDNIGVTVPSDENDDIERFKQQIIDFRQWMADRGYRDHALVVYEYGILLPVQLGYDADRVNRFMTATFDFFMTATDEETGYSADDNRLVQKWAWYSLNDYLYTYEDRRGFNGNLLDWETGELTSTGEVFREYIRPDLAVVSAELISNGSIVTAVLTVENLGISPIKSGIIRGVIRNENGASTVKEIEVTNLLGGENNRQQLEILYTDVEAGIYNIRLFSDPEDVLAETNESNNVYVAAFEAASVNVTGIQSIQKNDWRLLVTLLAAFSLSYPLIVSRSDASRS